MRSRGLNLLDDNAAIPVWHEAMELVHSMSDAELLELQGIGPVRLRMAVEFMERKGLRRNAINASMSAVELYDWI